MTGSKEFFIREAKELNKEQFLKKYPHPFLVQYTASENKEGKRMSFSTISVRSLDELLKIEAQDKKEIQDVFPVKKTENNPFSSKIIIGRTATQDIIIDSSSISKFHAYFEIKEGKYLFYDKGSTNGSKLNNMELEASMSVMVRNNDIISLASLNYTFYYAETAYEVFRR